VDKILVYGADWCGDCRRSKRFLDTNKIAYNWIDVEANPEEIENMKKLNGGRQSIPTILLPDGTVLVEPSNGELARQIGIESVAR
jgi:mycoredoxin